MFTQTGAQLQTLTYKIAHPPVITLREDITEEATIADRAEVSFGVSAEDVIDEAVVIVVFMVLFGFDLYLRGLRLL
jgi:hypothetical protein